MNVGPCHWILAHQKRFLLNRFRRGFEPVHWFWTGSCTNDTADLTPSAVHAVFQFLNRFKRCVSRKPELWTGPRVWTGSNGEIPPRPTLDMTIMFHTIDNAFATHYEPVHGFELVQTPPKQIKHFGWNGKHLRAVCWRVGTFFWLQIVYFVTKTQMYTQTLNQNETMK